MLKLIIHKPEMVVFGGAVSLCEVPGNKGRFVILQDHDSIISTLQPGNIRYVVDGEEILQPVTSGYVGVHNNVISACVHL